jgi:hypothetical protein
MEDKTKIKMKKGMPKNITTAAAIGPTTKEEIINMDTIDTVKETK